MLITEENQHKLFPGVKLEVLDTEINTVITHVKSFDTKTNELICYHMAVKGRFRCRVHMTNEDKSLFSKDPNDKRKILLTQERHHHIQIRNKETGEILAGSNKNLLKSWLKLSLKIRK